MSKKQEKAKLIAERLAKREKFKARHIEPTWINQEAYILSGTKHYRKVLVDTWPGNRSDCWITLQSSGYSRNIQKTKVFASLQQVLEAIEHRKALLAEIKARYIDIEHVFDDLSPWRPEYAEERESNP